jgi:hypothetical protein
VRFSRHGLQEKNALFKFAIAFLRFAWYPFNVKKDYPAVYLLLQKDNSGLVNNPGQKGAKET